MSAHISGGHAPYKALEWPIFRGCQCPSPLHPPTSKSHTPVFMFKRVKKINQCQCLFPFEANKVHTVWSYPAEHHFVPMHCCPRAIPTNPPAVPLVKVRGAFGVLWRPAFRIALSSALLDLFSDIWPLACKTLALWSWNVTGACCQLTDTSAWQVILLWCATRQKIQVHGLDSTQLSADRRGKLIQTPWSCVTDKTRSENVNC